MSQNGKPKKKNIRPIPPPPPSPKVMRSLENCTIKMKKHWLEVTSYLEEKL